ncbi:MAG: glycosyltransferase [bacterium]
MRYLKLPGLNSPHQEANLKAFEAVSPGLAQKIVVGQNTSEIGLAIAEGNSFGAFSVRDNATHWVHQPGNVTGECTRFAQELFSKQFQNYDLFVLTRFGLGFFWQALISSLRLPLQSYGIIVVEPDPGWLFTAASAHDLSKFILYSNTFWITGPDWREQCAEVIERRFLHGCRQSLIMPGHPHYAPFHPAEHGQIKETVEKILCQKRASFDDDVRSFAESRTQPGPDAPRRLWSLSDRRPSYRVLYQVSEPFLEAFERVGLEVHRGIREGTQYYPQLTSLHEFMESDADSFFSVNSPFDEVMLHPQSAAINAIKIIWYVDHPYYLWEFQRQPWEEAGKDLFAERLRDHHIFLYDAGDRFFLSERGITPAGYIPHFGIFLGDDIHENPDFRCDVSFLGTLYQLPGFLTGMPQADMPPCLEYIYSMGKIVYQEALLPPFFDGLLDRNPPPPVLEKYLRPGMPLTHSRLSKMIHLDADNRYRIDCVQALAPFDFILVGDRYWLECLGDHPVKRAWRVRIGFDDLPGVYKASKINVNISSRQLRTAHTHRTFNAIGIGRLTLSNYFKGMEHIFERGTGIDYFTTPDELREKVQYYLDRPDEREAIARKGRDAVLTEHKPEDRARLIIEIVRDRIQHGESVYRSFRDWDPPDYKTIQPPPG